MLRSKRIQHHFKSVVGSPSSDCSAASSKLINHLCCASLKSSGVSACAIKINIGFSLFHLCAKFVSLNRKDALNRDVNIYGSIFWVSDTHRTCKYSLAGKSIGAWMPLINTLSSDQARRMSTPGTALVITMTISAPWFVYVVSVSLSKSSASLWIQTYLLSEIVLCPIGGSSLLVLLQHRRKIRLSATGHRWWIVANVQCYHKVVASVWINQSWSIHVTCFTLPIRLKRFDGRFIWSADGSTICLRQRP